MNYSSQDFEQLLNLPFSSKKTHEEKTSIIKNLFTNPQDLVIKFMKVCSVKTKNCGIEIGVVLRFFENMDKLNLTSAITQSLKSSLEQLENKQRLDHFLAKKGNLYFFFIIMLWDKLFLIRENNLVLLKFLNLIRHLGTHLKQFSSWCYDLPYRYLKMQVVQLLLIMQEQFPKAVPGAVQPNLLHIVHLNIQNICQFLSILYISNQKGKRVSSQNFICQSLAKYYEPAFVFKQYLTKKNDQNFLKYPFLLDLDFKYQLLRYESVYEQKVSMHKNLTHGLQNLFNGHIQFDANGNFSVQNLAYLHFEIHRDNILDDSMEKLGRIKNNLKNPLKIQFIGEEGRDEGGVQNQYFHVVTEQIFRGYLDMFVPKNNSRVYWFNSLSFEPPIRFEFVGMLFGIAIYNSVHLDVKFPQVLYKKLLNQDSQKTQNNLNEFLQELNQIEPQYYRSLKTILESNENLDDLEMFFTIEIQNYGQKIIQNLIENGDKVKLSQQNKKQYIFKICEFFLEKSIAKSLQAFKKGFNKVVDTELIKIFTPNQLEVIITGKQVIDFKELQTNAQYEGFTKNSPVIKNLWKVLNELSLSDKKAFLMFCTGSDRAPLSGLKSLKFVIQKHANSDHLPTAHTCFNVLLLPEYETLEKLKKNIELILRNNQGFGLI